MKIDINDLTLGQIKEITANCDKKSNHPYEIGKAYFIRTVTMNYIGIIKKVLETEIILSNASWIADSGRFYNALKEGTLSEVYPFIDDVIIGLRAIIDAALWNHKLPEEQK